MPADASHISFKDIDTVDALMWRAMILSLGVIMASKVNECHLGRCLPRHNFSSSWHASLVWADIFSLEAAPLLRTPYEQ